MQANNFLTLRYRDTIMAITEFYQISDVFVWQTHVSICVGTVEESRSINKKSQYDSSDKKPLYKPGTGIPLLKSTIKEMY